jgi:hypothetical protein
MIQKLMALERVVVACGIPMSKMKNMPMTREQHQEWLGTARNASSSWKYVHLLTEPPDSILLQTKPSSLPKLQKALDQGMIVAPRRLQTSTATRVRRLGWNEQESKQNITTLHPWDEGAVCWDEYSQDYHKPWDEQYPKCNFRIGGSVALKMTSKIILDSSIMI